MKTHQLAIEGIAILGILAVVYYVNKKKTSSSPLTYASSQQAFPYATMPSPAPAPSSITDAFLPGNAWGGNLNVYNGQPQAFNSVSNVNVSVNGANYLMHKYIPLFGYAGIAT
jgi:hypothetical protein